MNLASSNKANGSDRAARAMVLLALSLSSLFSTFKLYTYVIENIVAPCFNWLSLLNSSLVGKCTGNKTFNRKKSLMFKYGRMQKKISSWLVCGCHGACLDCMLPGVQVTIPLGFFCAQVIYVIVSIVLPCFNRPSLLSRSLVEINLYLKNKHLCMKIMFM